MRRALKLAQTRPTWCWHACEPVGDEFTAEIEHAIEHISRHPHAAPVARGALRAKTLMKFPYSLVYFVGESEITLLAVAHQKRRPFYWTSRL